MAKYPRYIGEFLSHAGVTWRVEILQDADEAFAAIGALTFPAEDPLLIEWDETDKEEPLCPSVATLTIESPGDRTYADLYTITPGAIRLDVYRAGQLWWSGLLDPEFYREPYDRGSHYDVSLTFSDLGVLDRIDFDSTGVKSLREITQQAITATGLNYTAIDDSHTSTHLETDADGLTGILDALAIRCDNFYDEGGEPSTLKEVLEGLFQPLGLRLIQRAGKIYIYDLNGLREGATPREITWDGVDSQMGVDKVASEVKISFSAYAQSELMDGEMDFPGDYSADQINTTASDTTETAGYRYWSFLPDYNNNPAFPDRNDVDFTIFTSWEPAKGVAYTPLPKFLILPMGGSMQETTGILAGIAPGCDKLSKGEPYVKKYQELCRVGDPSYASNVALRTDKAFVPALPATADGGYRPGISCRDRYRLRLTLEMLFDPRYNPYNEYGRSGKIWGQESPTLSNEDGNYDAAKANTAWAFVPVAVNLYNANGTALYHYDNSRYTYDPETGAIGNAPGQWVEGKGGYGSAWLEYYSTGDPSAESGLLGWSKNRHCVGRADKNHLQVAGKWRDGMTLATRSFLGADPGQYIPFPPVGGWIEITVYQDVRCFAYNEAKSKNHYIDWYHATGDKMDYDTPSELFGLPMVWGKDAAQMYKNIRWWAYRLPVLEMVAVTPTIEAATCDDVDYTGYINKAAKEELSIDTVCGTLDKLCPSARGVYLDSSGQQVYKLTRAGITDHPERLLIGTLISQYADRRTTLSGDAAIDAGGLTTYTERCQGDALFMVKGEEVNCTADTTNAVYVELAPEEYEPIEEVE